MAKESLKTTTSSSRADDPNLEHKLDLVTADAQPFVKEHLLNKITHVNFQIIISYIIAFITEVNPKPSYRINTIQKLKQLAEFHNPKSFKDMTRDDVITFLDRLRKTETADPLHKWVSTYEGERIILLRFFKWLYGPDIPHNYRPKPEIMQNISKINRKEISSYKPSDLWTEEDDLMFCKYCPSNRDRAYHMVARNTGCRPHELLGAKIKDLIWINTDTYQVAQLLVNGKTGQGKQPITSAVPYLKDWLSNSHPFPNNPNSYIFCGEGKKNTGRKLAKNTMNTVYRKYQFVVFPKLLKDPLVPPEDKQHIKFMLDTRRWNPYTRRHTALTEVSTKVSTPVLHQYARWSPGSKMDSKYVHYFSDESFNDILKVQGINVVDASGSTLKKDILKPKICFECNEPNKPDAKICVSCKHIIDKTLYLEKEKEAEHTKKEIEELKDRFRILEINTHNLVKHALGLRELTPEERKEREEQIRLDREEFAKRKGIKVEDILKKKEKEIAECDICSPTYRCSWHGGPKNVTESNNKKATNSLI